ncbi:hypothetical protein [Rhizobium laguerreae]|uniref:hypothetical protein n=1 Tax=Rhizobium laguerreae TaxID=1076926 RepID=UPI001C919242|nr:hypothetical protein [Rhizobium laguerreae]MBY3187929.1 hypothetical protein [Rhizobium laguerreae]
MSKMISTVLAATTLASCSGVPPYDLASSDKTYGAPVIRVASIMANLKCELWAAANDQTELPQFENDTTLALEQHEVPANNRRFTLQNIFGAIEYVGEVELTIDATNTAGANPSLSFPGLGSAAHPLSIGLDAGLSEKGHRSNTTYHSIDFERLVEGPEQPAAARPVGSCGRGSELRGHLGLAENLKMGLVASSMNDLSVFPNNASNPGVKGDVIDAKYTAGQIHAVIDFTTTASVSGGPKWELEHFVGPNSNEGLFNHKRESLNQMTFTFLPICIRGPFKGTPNGARWNYEPRLPQGSPAWADYLPPCSKTNAVQAKSRAVSRAHEINIMSLDNLRLRAF